MTSATVANEEEEAKATEEQEAEATRTLGQTMFKPFQLSYSGLNFALYAGNFLVFTLHFFAPSNFSEIFFHFWSGAVFLYNMQIGIPRMKLICLAAC